MSKMLFFLLTSLHLTGAHAAEKHPELIVYTYDSFISNWGPGPLVKREFESFCNCKVKWVAAADGAALLARLKIEGKNTKADVVLGIDDTLTTSAERLGLFAEIPPRILPKEFFGSFKVSSHFMPYDYGFYAFMFDTKARQKNGDPFPKPKTLNELLTSKVYKQSIIIQDPRSSASGLGLLLWLEVVYGKNLDLALRDLASQTLTVNKGWSDSYNLFTKGEAPIVLSYTTSEAYHRETEKTDRFQALLFPEGHYVTIENAGILNNSKHQDLARVFLEFLTRESTQKTIARFNWMYPVRNLSRDAVPAILALRRPEKVLHTTPEIIDRNRRTWVNHWEKAFSR